MSTVAGANHVREGFVIKPIVERYAKHFGRVVLKMVGQGYHLRSNGLPPKEIQPEVDAAVARANAEMERILAGQDPEVEAAKVDLLSQPILDLTPALDDKIDESGALKVAA